MPRKQHVVRLTPAERAEVRALVGAGVAPARTQTHARILLKRDAGVPVRAGPMPESPRRSRSAPAPWPACAPASPPRVWPRRWRGVPAGVPPRKLESAQEARLVALACTAPPAGQARWSLRLLAERLVELEVVAGIGPERCAQRSKKRPQAVAEAALVHPAAGGCRLRGRDGGCPARLRPPARSGAAAGLLRRGGQGTAQPTRGPRSPPAPGRPGAGGQRVRPRRQRQPASSGLRPAPGLARGHGTARAHRRRLGARHARPGRHRTSPTPSGSCWCWTTSTPTPRPRSTRPSRRPRPAHLDALELHYTPNHGSWLNIAELELSALARQCLARRIPDQATLAAEVAAWAAARNAAGVRIRWPFTSADARPPCTHLYPVPQPAI